MRQGYLHIYVQHIQVGYIVEFSCLIMSILSYFIGNRIETTRR